MVKDFTFDIQLPHGCSLQKESGREYDGLVKKISVMSRVAMRVILKMHLLQY